MRRKIIQDFANTFCQRFIDLPSGYSLASLAHYGSGEYGLDILRDACFHNGAVIPTLATCDEYRNWMFEQMDKHHIPREGVVGAALHIHAKVEAIRVDLSYGHRFASAHFFFDCRSEIRTDEKTYSGRMVGDKTWGFDYYYLRLYDDFPEGWSRVGGDVN